MRSCLLRCIHIECRKRCDGMASHGKRNQFNFGFDFFASHFFFVFFIFADNTLPLDGRNKKKVEFENRNSRKHKTKKQPKAQMCRTNVSRVWLRQSFDVCWWYWKYSSKINFTLHLRRTCNEIRTKILRLCENLGHTYETRPLGPHTYMSMVLNDERKKKRTEKLKTIKNLDSAFVIVWSLPIRNTPISSTKCPCACDTAKFHLDVVVHFGFPTLK